MVLTANRPAAAGVDGCRTRASKTRRAERVTRVLEDLHGTPDLGNKEDPLDELVFIVLSQMTTSKSFGRVFDRLKRAVTSWDQLVDMPVRRLKSIIKDAGLSNQKAPKLKAIMRRLRADFGVVNLDALRGMDDQAAHEYLISLPGVGTKSAKCVLMYSLGRDVLPVDTHVARLTSRLGLLASDTTTYSIHDALEAIVPPSIRYSLHVNAIVHGRTVCVATSPRCHQCPLKRACPSRSL
ncbi:MAG: hypothetical protein K2Y37_01190 [Pirellulales bacterium]|nr:hypothetical protein [Pirellulales bacterium]